MSCHGRITWPCYNCLFGSVQVLCHMEPYPHFVVTLLFWGVDTCGCIHWIQFQHTLAEHLALLRVVILAESCLLVCTMGALLDGACYHGACLYNQQDILAWIPLYVHNAAFDLICDPKKSHFHGSGTLFLDSIICNSCCCHVVTVYGRGRLRMAHFL